MSESTVTAKPLSALLAARASLPKAAAARAADALSHLIAEGLAQGHPVRLKGVGILTVMDVPARSGTAPNGAVWTKPPGRRVVFRVSAALKAAVEGSL